jgi:uncharacterized protein with von Willebrand factor type A (vWA) domain
VRASLGTGGVPLVTHHRPHRPHKPELTVLCDVSGSVAGFAHFTLMLSYALSEQFTKVRAFAFIDTSTRCPASSPPAATWPPRCPDVGRGRPGVAGRAQRLRPQPGALRADYPDAVGPRTSLLVLGDARNNYRATGVATLRSLVQRARHAYWLNPEPAAYWGSGDSATAQYAEVIEMVECRNALQLEQFVQRLLPG